MSNNTALRAALTAAFVLSMAPPAIWGQKAAPLCSSTATTETCLIDDFSSPGGKAGMVGPIRSGYVQPTQTSSGAVGGNRMVLLQFDNPANNEFNQPAQAQVVPSKTEGIPSALVLSGGYKAYAGLAVFYGQGTDIGLNLSNLDRIRVSVDGMEVTGTFILAVTSPTNSSPGECSIAIPVFGAGGSASPFTVDFPETQLNNANAGETVDWSDITAISFFDTESSDLGAPNFAITSISVVPKSAGPAEYTCSSQPAVR